MSRALAEDWPDIPDLAPGELALVCRPNLDVHLWPESVRYLWLDRAQRQAGKDKHRQDR